MIGPINGGDGSASALRLYGQNVRAVGASMQKLATGNRINSGKDDPAGLIAAENLEAALAMLEAESRMAGRIEHIASTADAALGEASDLLIEGAGLAVAAANTGAMSDAERDAIQLQLDATLDSVDRLAGTTRFNGQNLLDGSASLSFGGANIALDSIATSAIGEVNVDGDTHHVGDARTGGAIALGAADAAAEASLQTAIDDVIVQRARLGAFAGDVAAQSRAKADAFENTAAALSSIRDTDYGEETARAARNELLARASARALQLTNELPRSTIDIIA